LSIVQYSKNNRTQRFGKWICFRLLKNWIEKRYKGNEEQSGFTKGRSTADHISVFRQIYGSVPRILLWKALGKADVNKSIKNYWKYIEQ
jgi:hypothetical protein